MAVREDSSALDDLVSDGVVKLVELNDRLPAEVSVSEFRSRAIGHLMLYYRHRYRHFIGLYRGRNKTDRRRVVLVRHDLDRVDEEVIAVPDADLLLMVEIEDFLEGYECDYPRSHGAPSPSPSSSGGVRGRQPWGLKKPRAAGYPPA